MAIDHLELGERLQQAQQQAARAVAELARAIAQATDVKRLMANVAEAALAVANATGSFVEGIITPELVEILATTGKGAPSVGQRVAYPGSLTEEIIEHRKPVVLVKMKGIGKAMAPYLQRTCDGCSALVVPILGARDPLGALVILRQPDEPEFDNDDVEGAKTVGDLTSIAMQRMTTLEESERGRQIAEAAVRSRDDVLAVVSHDLRNPLHTIVASISLLDDEELELTPEQRKEQLEIIDRSARRMDSLIKDLLDVTRLEGGRFKLQRRCEDAGQIGREACESIRAIAEEKALRLSCEVSDDVRQVFVDRGRLLQALGNYLGNAVKFTPPEGNVILRTTPTTDGGVRFAVTDSGPGIPDDQLEHVFDRFWQGRRSTGSGLGLAIARGIADAHGGRAWVESRAGVGSTFYIEVPAAEECP